MTTFFDDLPFSFDYETVKDINDEHVKIQNERYPNLALPHWTDLFRADVIHSLLGHIADNSENVNSSDVLRLAAYAAEWYEAIRKQETTSNGV